MFIFRIRNYSYSSCIIKHGNNFSIELVETKREQQDLIRIRTMTSRTVRLLYETFFSSPCISRLEDSDNDVLSNS